MDLPEREMGSVYFDPLKAHSFTDSESKGVMHEPFASMLNKLNRGSNPGGSSLPVDLQSRDILVAVSSLLRAGRHEMALAVLDDELGRGC